VLFNVLFKVFFLFEKNQIDAFLGASNGFVMQISKSSKRILKNINLVPLHIKMHFQPHYQTYTKITFDSLSTLKKGNHIL
jgi:hypothetical protein